MEARLEKRLREDDYLQWFVAQVRSFGEHRPPAIEWWVKVFIRIDGNQKALDIAHSIFRDARSGESLIVKPLRLLAYKLKHDAGVILPRLPEMPKPRPRPKPEPTCTTCWGSGTTRTGFCSCRAGREAIKEYSNES